MDHSKIVSQKERSRRGLNALCFIWSMLLSIPLLGVLFAMFLIFSLAGIVLGKSAQRLKDLGWIGLGTAIGIAGMVVELLWMGAGWWAPALALSMLLNFLIMKKIVFGPLKHISMVHYKIEVVEVAIVTRVD